MKAYLEETLAKARREGFVETEFKRRRYIPDIVSKDPRARSFAERTATNAPIQGTASDIIKIAMIEIEKEIGREALRSRMILQVHDELLFDVPSAELSKMTELVREKMQGAVNFKVPMKVDVKVGPNWLDMKEAGV